ncbi:MAG: STAS domain-containing protein [Clostridia bacterium]|nr:STAS domain-containing protein [Clostridia bacterium]
MLNIEKNREGSALVVSLQGRLDTTTAPLLERELKESLGEITDLTINMEGLEYISSAGLRVLLLTEKVMNKQGAMKITNVNETIMEIFEVTGFSDILTIGTHKSRNA